MSFKKYLKEGLRKDLTAYFNVSKYIDFILSYSYNVDQEDPFFEEQVGDDIKKVVKKFEPEFRNAIVSELNERGYVIQNSNRPGTYLIKRLKN